MARNFHLPSLDLSSPFEDEAGELTMPDTIATGDHPGLAIVVGGYRPPTSPCRFLHPDGLVGIQLAGPLPPVVRVRVVLRTDWLSDGKWHERAQRIFDARSLRGINVDDVQLELGGRARHVELFAQGRTRGRALLRRQDDPEAFVRQRLVFDVATDELDESGLLLLGLGPVTAPVPDPGLPDPVVGVVVRRVVVELPDGPLPGTVSTGRHAKDGWAPYDAETGFAVVNAPDDRTPVRVEVARPAGPGGIAGRLAKRRRPEIDVQVTGASGTPVPVEHGPGGTVTFTVPAGECPAVLRAGDDADVVVRVVEG